MKDTSPKRYAISWVEIDFTLFISHVFLSNSILYILCLIVLISIIILHVVDMKD